MYAQRSFHAQRPTHEAVVHRFRSRAWALAIVALTALRSAGAAEPYLPRDDKEVLETLPTALFANRDEVATLRQRLEADPLNPAVCASTAARFMKLGSQTGDARFYGYARAAIHAWWQSDDPPPEILRLRAKLQEKNHDYDLALADLKLLLKRDPRDVQGWIEASNIFRVQGKYDQARKACDQLGEFAGPFATGLCRAPIMALTGEASEAYDLLETMLPEARRDYPTTVQWIRTMQAEIAVALGRVEAAEQHLRDGLASAPEDKYLRRAYGEFLLDHGRDAEALSLVVGHSNDDGLLLTAAIAAHRLGEDEQAAQLYAQLESRFAEIRQRGDQPLGRFEARFVLILKNDPPRALELAMANWRLQKETHDTQTALEAAIAAHDSVQALPIRDFLAKNHTEHAAIQKLVEQLTRTP